jgi:hypothetical protein
MRPWLILSSVVLIAALAGCSGSGSSSSTTSSAQTPAQTFQALQKSGALPTLDVSSTIAGTDANNNGVRDDLDAYIAALGDSTAGKSALTQLAGAIQGTMTVTTTNATAVTTASNTLNRAVNCVWTVYGKQQAHAKVMLMEELSVNTMPRLTAYEAYNSARNGASITLASGNTCN